ncbi:hypothetical protein Agub_g15508 [Astrephomene gubernaculifera]|uniref:CHY-type domain-containing protein n=1 Tax=Astrephomene gubernaculifera TaxID=47775 RepID=A0AAD3E4S7_9CHLO|nr:hypothetical protein Agub_g15508 [Astrephomene gubernaculifera]
MLASHDEDRSRMEALQAELQALKAHLGRAVRLQRSSPAEAPATAPFPITMTVQIDPPPTAAAHYDVSAIQVRITLQREALQLPFTQPSAAVSASGASDEAKCGGRLGVEATRGSPTQLLGASLEVLSNELPELLRNRMAQALAQAWQTDLYKASRAASPASATTSTKHGEGPSRGGGKLPSGPYKLSAAAVHLQEQFVQLICLVPELLEPYQAEDQYGATVRRYAIINDGPTAAVSAAGPAPAGRAAAESPSPLSTTSTPPVPPSAASQLHGKPLHGESPKPGSIPTGGPVPSPSAVTMTPGDRADVAVAPAAAAPQPRRDGPPMPQDTPGDIARTQAASHEARAPASAPVTPAPTPPSSSAAQPAAPSDLQQKTTATSAAPPPSPSPPAAPPPPPPPQPGLLSYNTALKELQYIQKRYSQVCSVRVHRQDAGGGGGGAAGGGVSQLLQPGCLTTFDLELLPTDPDWDMPAVRVVGQLLPVSEGGGAECLFLPSLGVHMGCRLAGWLRGALERYMEQQLTAEAAAVVAAEAAAAVANATAAAAAATEAAAAVAEHVGGDVAGSVGGHGRGRGGMPVRGRGAAGGRTAVGRGGGGGGRGAEAAAAAEAPEGTVLLPLGCLRNLLRNLENYAGSIARAADEERRQRELQQQQQQQKHRRQQQQQRRQRAVVRRDDGGAISSSSGGSGGANISGDDGADADAGAGGGGGGQLYDDDGYGDGSRRREYGTAAAPAGTEAGASSAAGRHLDEGSSGADYSDSGSYDDDYDGGASDDGGDGEGDEDEVEEEEGRAADEVRFSGAATAGGGGGELPAAFAVVLEGLQLDNLAVVEALRSSFEVSCARCDCRGTLVVSSEAVAGSSSSSGAGGSRPNSAAGVCPRCSTGWSLLMRPHYVHAGANCLCVVKPQGCRPLDLLPSLLAGQCAECSAVMSLREVQVGVPFTRACSSCHKELLLRVGAVSFVPRGPPAAAQRQPGGRMRQGQQRGAAGGGGGGGGVLVQPGQPLPALGTCRHYRHSYRWLRFPCCGMRFPCDLCHEEAVADGHPARWATRMVCGFCAAEQPLALACRGCGRQLAGSAANPSGRRTRFWEGGTGCRDPRRLNKNDPHKWRGRNKTQSAKASRVGPKPWSGRGGGGSGGAGVGGG